MSLKFKNDAHKALRISIMIHLFKYHLLLKPQINYYRKSWVISPKRERKSQSLEPAAFIYLPRYVFVSEILQNIYLFPFDIVIRMRFIYFIK